FRPALIVRTKGK
uniref:Hyposin-J1 n=1 Tax=Phasmahyla jandaia TaxID=762504 RepID=HPS1_PHAJA|nr:RecName: Full=Hyposin-J1; Short=HPS-J1 [Phasmahyla jandaia]